MKNKTRFKKQKKCSECGKNIASYNKTGLCQYHQKMLWNKKNKHKIRVYQEEYRKLNQEKIKKLQKRYRQGKKNEKKQIKKN